MYPPVTITVFSSFADAAEVWQTFSQDAAHYVYQNFDWLKTWYETIGYRNEELCLTVVAAENRPLMFLPLGIQRRASIRCLTWLGGEVSDYHGPLLARDNLINAGNFPELWAQLLHSLPPFDAVCFEKMPEFIETETNPFGSLRCIANASSGHFTKLGNNFDQFLKATISKNGIKDSRRNTRRIAESGPIQFELAATPEQIAELLDTMIRQKAQSYQELGVNNLFKQPGVMAFFKTVSASPLVHLSALRAGTTVLASHWGLRYGKRFYYMYPSYERNELSKYSPGTLLLWKLLEWAIDEQLEVFDFTIGDEPYKDKWCQAELKLFDFYQGISVKGKVYAGLLLIIKRLKRFLKQNPFLWKLIQSWRARR